MFFIKYNLKIFYKKYYIIIKQEKFIK